MNNARDETNEIFARHRKTLKTSTSLCEDTGCLKVRKRRQNRELYFWEPELQIVHLWLYPFKVQSQSLGST